MNIDQLKYFEAIARYGSFSAAARHLNVSQQALSHYISDLNRSIGRPLFRKQGRNLVVTEDGEKYLTTARDILNVMAQTTASISEVTGKARETVRIGLTGVTGLNILNKHLFQVISVFPELQLDVFGGDSSDLPDLVRDGELDIAIGHPYGNLYRGVEQIPLSKMEFVLCVPAHHELAADAGSFEELPVLDLAGLKNEVFIMPNNRQSQARFQKQIFEEAGFIPTVAMRCANTNMMFSLIEHGLGIGFAPYRPENEQVRFLRLDTHPETEESLFFRKGYILSKAERYITYLMSVEARRDRPETLVRSGFLDSLEEEFREY